MPALPLTIGEKKTAIRLSSTSDRVKTAEMGISLRLFLAPMMNNLIFSVCKWFTIYFNSVYDNMQ